jgi:hypothetical protein
LTAIRRLSVNTTESRAALKHETICSPGITRAPPQGQCPRLAGIELEDGTAREVDHMLMVWPTLRRAMGDPLRHQSPTSRLRTSSSLHSRAEPGPRQPVKRRACGTDSHRSRSGERCQERLPGPLPAHRCRRCHWGRVSLAMTVAPAPSWKPAKAGWSTPRASR